MVTRTYWKILLLVMYKLLYKSLSCYQKNKTKLTTFILFVFQNNSIQTQNLGFLTMNIG